MPYYKPYEGPKAKASPQFAYDYRPGMPLLDGHYTALEYCPKQKLKAYREAWRTWMQNHPKSEWPYHVTDYIEKLKRENNKAELLDLHGV